MIDGAIHLQLILNFNFLKQNPELFSLLFFQTEYPSKTYFKIRLNNSFVKTTYSPKIQKNSNLNNCQNDRLEKYKAKQLLDLKFPIKKYAL